VPDLSQMTDADPSTRDRLVATAARLFRQRGYNGVGIADILANARAPKGSLYHHFPAGKSDLALAAADAISLGMIEIIDAAFLSASDYRDGATTLCYKLAKLFDITDGTNTCPISAMLFDGPENDAFRAHANRIFGGWIACIADHARNLGHDPGKSADDAELLLTGISGAWTLARARRSADVLRALPARLFR
jgi:TetR/AcrR family transcriptional regulator, lmrAB and yxaGH operons repressor